MKQEIRKAHENADIIICYLHIGGQYNEKPIPYTLKMTDKLLKLGCNVVIGNHEHVIHGYKMDDSGQKLATYAIGNFLGSSGNLEPPYDRFCDFSIAINAYVDEKK